MKLVSNFKKSQVLTFRSIDSFHPYFFFRFLLLFTVLLIFFLKYSIVNRMDHFLLGPEPLTQKNMKSFKRRFSTSVTDCSLGQIALLETPSKSRKLVANHGCHYDSPKEVQKSSLSSLAVESVSLVPERPLRPADPWASVGGLDDHIKILRECIILPLLYPQLYEQLSISAPGLIFLSNFHNFTQ